MLSSKIADMAVPNALTTRIKSMFISPDNLKGEISMLLKSATYSKDSD